MTELSLEDKARMTCALLQGLGYDCQELPGSPDCLRYALDAEGQSGLQLQLESRTAFVEFCHVFVIPIELQSPLSADFYKISELCYEHGIYFLLDHTGKEMRLNLCTKLFFSGLHYYALIEALKDLGKCVGEVEVLLAARS